MSHYAATKARLEKQRAWDDVRDRPTRFPPSPSADRDHRPSPSPAPLRDRLTPRPLPSPPPQMHPHEFKRISRRARPTDRASMAGDKTLEEARTALERRRALEHEAVLAHLERVRVAAIEKTPRRS